MAAARANEASLVRVLQQADSLMTKIQQGNGTLGMLATDSTLYRETTATVIQFRELLTDIQAQSQEVPEDLGVLMSKRRAELEVSAGGIVFRRVPDGGPRFPAHQGFLRQLGLSQGPPRGRRVAGRGGACGRRRRRPGSSRLVLQGPIRVIDWHFRFRGRHIHKYCHFFLFESPDGEPCPQADEGITACQWRTLEEALETLSYDNARGVLKRAGEMVRTLVAVGAGRSRPAAERQAPRLTVAAIAALLESRAALLALRRTLPKSGPGVVACRDARGAAAACSSGGWSTRSCSAPASRLLPELADAPAPACPGIPVVAYAPFRPDDGELLLACRRHARGRAWRSRAWTIRSWATW